MKNKIQFLCKIMILIFITSVSLAKNSKDIIVAIIDTGIDIDHPFFKNRLWTNTKEIANSKDNDGNGFAGDLHGWNFVDNNADLKDNHGHGTHVAGIILQQAASTSVKFMILKYYDPKKAGSSNLLNTVKALHYAIQMKADIINYSGGGDSPSPMEEAAIRAAEQQGILIIAAAGNDGRNIDQRGFFPAGYRLKNIISVAAMDDQHKLLPNSNFGSHSVDLMAPGKNIFSTLPGGKFGFMTGTSMATAWVSGFVAGLMDKTASPWSPEKMKKFVRKLAAQDRGASDLRLAVNFSSRD